MSERYEIKRRIGHGGLGEVYVATDTQLGREVALKRIRPSEKAAGEQAEGDLLREAKTTSSLQHPNIVTVYDVGRDEKGPFVVMELLKGETLDRTVERGALTLDDFRRLATQTLEGMIAAQSVGLLHRDIKPGNMMVIWLPSGKFQVKILDFGLAKISQQPSTQTSDHEEGILGSIYFMAPEQFERAPLDMRTDMYSLGCVYYYTLTQQHPFTGETAAQVMASHLRHVVRELSELRPDLPEEVCTWVMWLMNRNMHDRPADAKEALAYFREGAEGATAPAEAQAPARPRLITGVPAARAVPATAPPTLAAAARRQTGSIAGQQTRPLAPGAAARPAKAPSPFPKWAYVTIPLLLVAVVVAIWYYVSQSMNRKEEFERFKQMAAEESPQGDAATVEMLIKRMQQGGDNAVTAALILTKLEGPGVNQAIVERINSIAGNPRINLIRAAAVRKYSGATDELIKAAKLTKDPEVRVEALAALREVAAEKDLDALLGLIPNATRDDERLALREAVLHVLEARPTVELRAAPLIKALNSADRPEARSLLVSMLARVGGEDAFKAAAALLDESDEEVQRAALRALGNWPSSRPAEGLLSIAQSDHPPLTRTIALLSYIQLAGSSEDIPMSQRVEMIARALEVADELKVPQAKREAFQQLSLLSAFEAVDLAEKYADDPALGPRINSVKAAVAAGLERLVDLSETEGWLPAAKALIQGDGATYLSRTGGGVIEEWNDPFTSLVWTFKAPAAGDYQIVVEQAALGDQHGGNFRILVGGESRVAEVKATGGEEKFVESEIGSVTLPAAGIYRLVLEPIELNERNLMILRRVGLKKAP